MQWHRYTHTHKKKSETEFDKESHALFLPPASWHLTDKDKLVEPFSVVLYVAWKRWLHRKCARFVLFRLIKKRSFNLLCVLNRYTQQWHQGKPADQEVYSYLCTLHSIPMWSCSLVTMNRRTASNVRSILDIKNFGEYTIAEPWQLWQPGGLYSTVAFMSESSISVLWETTSTVAFVSESSISVWGTTEKRRKKTDIRPSSWDHTFLRPVSFDLHTDFLCSCRSTNWLKGQLLDTVQM